MPSKKHIQQKIRELEHKLYELRGMYEEHYQEQVFPKDIVNDIEQKKFDAGYIKGWNDCIKQITDLIILKEKSQ